MQVETLLSKKLSVVLLNDKDTISLLYLLHFLTLGLKDASIQALSTRVILVFKMIIPF